MSLFCGFGYSIICYELLLKTDYISKVHGTKEKYIMNKLHPPGEQNDKKIT